MAKRFGRGSRDPPADVDIDRLREAVDLETDLLVRTLDLAPVERAWDDALDARIRDDTDG